MALSYSQPLPLGWLAPDFSLFNTDDQEISRDDFAHYPGLLIIFTCNTCPFAKPTWSLLADLHKQFNKQVAFVAINSHADKTNRLESKLAMKGLLVEERIHFPYLLDFDQKVSQKYQASCTPEFYLFKNEGHQDFLLTYHGRLNDNWRHPELVTDQSLLLAIKKLVANLTPIMDQKPSMGCEIKNPS